MILRICYAVEVFVSNWTQKTGKRRKERYSLQTGVVNICMQSATLYWIAHTKWLKNFISFWEDQAGAVDCCGSLLLDYIYGWIHQFIKISQFIYLGPNGIQMKNFLYTCWKKNVAKCNYYFELWKQSPLLSMPWKLSFCFRRTLNVCLDCKEALTFSNYFKKYLIVTS